MRTLLALVVFSISLVASANTVLECKPREGKFETREIVVGNVVLTSDEVILFQLMPVFETVSFDPKKAEVESTRTGSWVTYTLERELDREIITLKMEGAGKVRRAYLTRESSFNSDEYFFDVLALKCTEF